MEGRKIVFNNEQYNILTSIRLGQTAFLICIDLLDKKIIYFKQEIVDGKVKLTSSVNLEATANEVNKKSLSNKKRILEAFIPKVHLGLANALFVDHKKVSDAFHKLTTEIDNCDLKYYMIENASIEETDEQIENFIVKFNGMNFSKDLEQVSEIKNELYYYNTNEEEVKPKVESVSNVNRIEQASTKEEDSTYTGPSVAQDPFATGSINLEEISTNQSVEAALNKHLEEYAPKKEEVVTPKSSKSKKINTILIVVALLAVGVSLYFTYFKKDKTYTTEEIMNKVYDVVSLVDVEQGIYYNVPENISSSYQEALNSKLVSANISGLKGINSDTVAWIQNDFLNIKYPVVKGATNSFYSNHDYMKDESYGGWIYLDANTDIDKIDRNNVIYGKSDAYNKFFYSLNNALTADFVKDINNQIIKLSTMEANTSWLVFSVYEIPNEDYYLSNEFKDDEDFKHFIEVVTKRSIHNFEVPVDENDKILTLTTSKDSENRIVVHAKLIKTDSTVSEENKEDNVDENTQKDNTETETKEEIVTEENKEEVKGDN